MEKKILKILLGLYIFLCILIAGLNYGYAPGASEGARELLNRLWHFYENEFKTLLIITAAILTMRIEARKGRTEMRRKNLWGITASALLVHIFFTRLSGNPELPFLQLPLPWSTTGLKLLDEGSSYYLNIANHWGAGAVSLSLVFFLLINLTALIGALFSGRRWFCSTLCLFNGFASEVFAPAFPLVGKKKKASPRLLKGFSILGGLLLTAALLFTGYRFLTLYGIKASAGTESLVSLLELLKYMGLELFPAMFFWIVFTGRGYCHYCPAGRIMGLLGKSADQKITTHATQCIGCGKCNAICPMSIDIKTSAREGKPVRNSRCVGCGHCVDACPTETLRYSTRFLDRKLDQSSVSSESSST